MGNVEVRIESVAYKGYGVARVHGKVVFIPYTVTGDQAKIEMIEGTKSYVMGNLIQIIQPSPWRVDPPCPDFGKCGGCQWQHINPSMQGELKRNILKDLLIRLGRLKEIPPITVIHSPQPYGYRSRIQLKAKNKSLGYYQGKSHQIVEVQKCLIAHPIINQMLPPVRTSFPDFPQMEEMEINVSPEEGKGILLLHLVSPRPPAGHFLRDFLQAQSLFKGVATVKRGTFTFFGDPSLNFTMPLDHEERKRDLKFRISPGSFFQINLNLNRAIIQTVLQFSEVDEGETVVDLYAGVGNLTLPLGMSAREVWGIEGNRIAVEDARFNAEGNHIRNCHFIHGRVEPVSLKWKRKRPEVIVLDPPRTGCKMILDQMVRWKPKKIVYVSCDPATFSRDLLLFDKGGYALHRLCLIDMFPQTYHMELVGLLTPHLPQSSPQL